MQRKEEETGIPGGPALKEKRARLLGHVYGLLDILEADGCDVANALDPCSQFQLLAKPPGGGSWLDYIKRPVDKGGCGDNDATNINRKQFDAILAKMRKNPDFKDYKLVPHGHHIVMKEAPPEAQDASKKARRVLCKFKINPYTDCRNLAYSPNWSHTEKYAKALLTELEKKNSASGVEKVLSDFGKRHRDGEWAT